MELDNKIIGRNIAKFRQLRDLKAADLAERVGMKEGAYSKYERGETAITIDFLNDVAKALNVDPIQILSATPTNFIESIQNSPGSANNIGGYVGGDFNNTDEKQTQLLNKLIENIISLNERMVLLLEKKV